MTPRLAHLSPDLGAVRRVRELAPELAIHASTQMTCTDLGSVELARGLGARRVVLARELSLLEIASIARATSCELEVFVHGALCVAYSRIGHSNWEKGRKRCGWLWERPVRVGLGTRLGVEAGPVAPPESCAEAIGADGWRSLAEAELLRDAGASSCGTRGWESAAERQLELPEGFGGSGGKYPDPRRTLA